MSEKYDLTAKETEKQFYQSNLEKLLKEEEQYVQQLKSIEEISK